MPRSKEIQEQMRNKIVDIYQSGKGYKAISKALGLQRTTVSAIIHKWRKFGTVANLPRSGQQGRCWPNGCPKQNSIVVPPLSNIMEAKKKKKKTTPTIGVKIEL